MRIRKHAGSLVASMQTAQEIPNTLAALQEYVKAQFAPFLFSEAELASLSVKPYDDRPDERIGWDQTLIITYQPDESKLRWVFGFCDQPLTN